jgi:hypothetical protein
MNSEAKADSQQSEKNKPQMNANEDAHERK